MNYLNQINYFIKLKDCAWGLSRCGNRQAVHDLVEVDSYQRVFTIPMDSLLSEIT